MMRRGKTSWRAIQVYGPGDEGLRRLEAAERLAALYRFQNGEAPPEQRFALELSSRVAGHAGKPLVDPSDVDWESFPLIAALEAVTCDELRRLRGLGLGLGLGLVGEPGRGSQNPSDLAPDRDR